MKAEKQKSREAGKAKSRKEEKKKTQKIREAGKAKSRKAEKQRSGEAEK